MINLSVVARITIGLVFVTVSILLVADMIGVLPDEDVAKIESRKKVADTLAVQFTYYARSNDRKGIRAIMDTLVKRNDDILSMALKPNNGAIIAQAGDHQKLWEGSDDRASTPTHTLVPIFRGKQRWATTEIRFTPLDTDTIFGYAIKPLHQLILFVILSSFTGFMFFMRRTLKHLDPTSIVPSRVKDTLDALSEGIILMDKQGRIVLVNNAFASKIGKDDSSIIGKKPDEWLWKTPGTDEAIKTFPWMTAIEEKTASTGTPMAFSLSNEKSITFMVNSSPIMGEKDTPRGALATFDDVTKLEEKNEQLSTTLNLLEESYDKINTQNSELQILATTDSLTGCLNRRAFFERFSSDLEKAKRGNIEIACIMSDIDFFKKVNDNYGHAAGDNILRNVSEKLREDLRESDMICRYGGEEFCITLWNTNISSAMKVANKIRQKIEDITDMECMVTNSFGVSSSVLGATTPEAIINQADQALYEAKESGRNCVKRWDDVQDNPETGSETSVPPLKSA